MPVCCNCPVAERPRVGNQPDLLGRLKIAPQYVVSALRKRPPYRKKCLPRFKLGECLVRIAYEPARSFIEVAGLGLEIGAVIQQRAGCEQSAISAEAGAQIEPQRSSVIGITYHRDVSADIHE